MLLRFQGVDLLSSPRVPSRVGNSELGSVLDPNRTVTDGGGSQSDSGSGSTVTPSAVASGKSDLIAEAYYNAGSAALILVIIFAGLALFVYFRNRAIRLGDGGDGFDGHAGRSGPRGFMRIPRFGQTTAFSPRSRRRAAGTGDASVHPERAGRRLWGKGEAQEGEPQELDELVRGDGTADDAEDDDVVVEDDLESGVYSREEKGKGVATVTAAKDEREAVVVGRAQEEEEEEEEADMFSLGQEESDEDKDDLARGGGPPR
jgi:hypothetical protein